jgi:predicted ATPase
MIKSFSVSGLNRSRNYKINFHPDVNIITGTNGSGKTNLVKLLWYMLSGNLERILPEISFKDAKLVTDKITLSIQNKTNIELGLNKMTVSMKTEGDHIEKHAIEYRSIEEACQWLNELNRKIIRHTDSSIFFPTFRRIEGGFALRTPLAHRPYETEGDFNSINRIFREYSARISVRQHLFVTSVSADDMVRIVTNKYAEASAETNKLHTELSSYIMRITGDTESSPAKSNSKSNSALDRIREKAAIIRGKQELALKPFSVVSNAVKNIFQHPGIRMTDSIIFGNEKGCIDVDLLSAGEKQMLGFLCYNTLFKDSVFCIDEPELSLHPDWQRTLIPMLLDQKSGNQIIATTHSPFIISKYPDKEIRLVADTGGCEPC